MIQKPREDVFAFVTNPANAPRWRVGLQDAKQITPGPMQAGTLIEESLTVLGRQLQSRVEILEFVPPEFRRIRVKLGPLPVELHERYEVTDAGTLLTVSGVTEVKGAQRLMARAAMGQIKRQLEQELATIKQILE